MSEALKPYLKRSAALHAAGLAAFLFLATRGAVRSDKVYMIDFVGGSTLASSRAQEAAAPAKGELAQPKLGPQADPDAIAPKGSKTIALPRPSLLKGWTEQKDLPKPSLGGSSAGPAASEGAGPDKGTGGSAGVSTDLNNFPFPWYIAQLRQMLWAQWQKRMPSGSAEGAVVFSILRNGTITDLAMESSSGDSDFDQAALDAVRAAAPFLELPSDFREPFLKIHLTVKSGS